MESFPIIEVTWRDAIGSDGWVDLTDILEATSTVHTQVGYLIEETDSELKLCMSFNDDLTNMGAWVVLPKAMVLTVRQIDVTRVILGTMDVDKSTL